MKNHQYLILGLLLALSFWLIDTLLHFLFIGNELGVALLPPDLNEIWMRSIIAVMLIGFGFFVDRRTQREQQRVMQIKSLEIYRTTFFASQRVLDNLLNQIDHLQQQALTYQGFDQELLARINLIVDDARALLIRFSNAEKTAASLFPSQVDKGMLH